MDRFRADHRASVANTVNSSQSVVPLISPNPTFWQKRRKRLTQTQKIQGQGLTEYIALLVLIALFSVGATKTLGKRIRAKLVKAAEKVNEDIKFEER